jgi:hypothetical protein
MDADLSFVFDAVAGFRDDLSGLPWRKKTAIQSLGPNLCDVSRVAMGNPFLHGRHGNDSAFRQFRQDDNDERHPPDVWLAGGRYFPTTHPEAYVQADDLLVQEIAYDVRLPLKA